MFSKIQIGNLTLHLGNMKRAIGVTPSTFEKFKTYLSYQDKFKVQPNTTLSITKDSEDNQKQFGISPAV